MTLAEDPLPATSAPATAAAGQPGVRIDPAAEISRRIEILRIVLVAGIVVLHTPPTWQLEALPPEASQWPGVIKLFFEHGPFRAGVPTLSLISGYLLFSRPYGSYRRLIGRKLVTLLLPFLVWNALVIALHGLRGQNDLSPLAIDGQGFGPWFGSLRALLDEPPDYPTYFLVDLFLCMLLAPLISRIMRLAPILALGVGGLMAAYGYGPVPTVRPDIILPFAAGAAIAVHRLDPRLLDRLWWQIGLVFLFLCVVFIADTAAGRPSHLSLGVLRVAGALAAWSFSAILARTALGHRLAGWSPYAYLIFCAHSPALNLLFSIWPNEPGSYWLFYSTAAPLVIVAVIALAILFERRGGRLINFLTGGRSKRGSAQG